MAVLVFVQPDGSETTVPVQVGVSAMRHAVENSVPGIDADCGGECMCATCHVFVDPEWVGRIAPAGDFETDMLGIVEDLADNSRLSCQIEMREDLDGLRLHLPSAQA